MSRTWREVYNEHLDRYVAGGVPIADAREWAKEDADEEFNQ